MSTITKYTKTDYILNDLMNGRTMTHHKAQAYGTYRLAAVVHRLRAQGHRIDSRTSVAADGTKYSEYYMPYMQGIRSFMA